MPKKRKTLPEDFEEMVKTADIEDLKAVFDKCELSAYTGYSKGTALSVAGAPEELVRWLVEQGLDVDTPDQYGATPLHHQITYHGSNDNIELLIELGADIEARKGMYKQTPLHTACNSYNTEAAKILLRHGADVYAEDWNKKTPLESALAGCMNADIPKTAEIAELMLKAGVKVNRKMKDRVTEIGKTFEFHRSGFNPDYLEETDKALKKLYKLFKVKPVPPVVKYDGRSLIKVKSKKWTAQHSELWELLVPPSGHADTVQGEVVRISGKLSYEILDNGGMNWDGDFKKMLAAMQEYLSVGKALDDGELEEVSRISSVLRNGDDPESEKDLNRMCELTVKWVLKNPEPIRLEDVGYKR